MSAKGPGIARIQRPHVVAGDIGGTQARFRLLPLDPSAPPIAEDVLAVAQHRTFEDALATFLRARDALDPPPIAGAFAVAGPVHGGRASLTNAPWTIEAGEVASRVGVGRVELLNDFEAAAAGVDALAPHDMLELQTGEGRGARLVIGAGTGLGVAYAIGERAQARIVAGEGGHVGFAPQDDEQMRLLAWLRRRLPRVSAEHVVSGAGIVRLYAFAARTSDDADDPLPPDVAADGAAAVARRAEQGEPAAQRAIDLFVAIFGAVAGDHAMSVIALGGVYLAGGIAPKLASALSRGAFLRAFNAKGVHASLMARMPVRLVLEERLGLIGAGGIARRVAGTV